jgi:hypothetical protein
MTDISGLVLVSAEYTIFGNKRIHTFSTFVGNGSDTLDVSGIQCPATNFGLKKVDFVTFDGGSLKYVYDYAKERVYGYWTTTASANMTIVDNAAPTSGIWVRIQAQGTGVSQ